MSPDSYIKCIPGIIQLPSPFFSFYFKTNPFSLFHFYFLYFIIYHYIQFLQFLQFLIHPFIRRRRKKKKKKKKSLPFNIVESARLYIPTRSFFFFSLFFFPFLSSSVDLSLYSLCRSDGPRVSSLASDLAFLSLPFIPFLFLFIYFLLSSQIRACFCFPSIMAAASAPITMKEAITVCSFLLFFIIFENSTLVKLNS